ncbi:MAG TPA: alanine racemase [Dehalococcoidia bacterium]|nr:alanine racemase [Dehalococcoidia bacterium]
MALDRPQTNGWWGRPLWAEIDLDALAYNVASLKGQAGPAAMAAVVKANAYGHGAVGIAQAALEAGAERLAVICVDEGEQLRRAGIRAPILVMGHSPVSDARRIVDLELTPTVNSLEMARALAREAEAAGVRQPLHLKVDSGLNRYGLTPAEIVPLAESLRQIPALDVEGIFTHFASADEGDKRFTLEQYTIFRSVVEKLPWIRMRHVSNTATLLDRPEMSLDLVRPGVGMYGLYPSQYVSRSLNLRPVLSLKSHVARLTSIAPGDSVSYGRTWRANRPSIIALVMCGYGDGLPRVLSNRGSVLVAGRRVPIVGRVCMDMCMADVTDVPDVAEGDEVVIIGRQGEAEIAAQEIGDLCGTISYEILCGITARVPRLYLRAGRLVGAETLTMPLARETPVSAG